MIAKGLRDMINTVTNRVDEIHNCEIEDIEDIKENVVIITIDYIVHTTEPDTALKSITDLINCSNIIFEQRIDKIEFEHYKLQILGVSY